MILVILLFSLFSCSHIKMIGSGQEAAKMKKVFSFEELPYIESSIPVGEVGTLSLPSGQWEEFKVFCGDKEILFSQISDRHTGFVSVPYGSKVGSSVTCYAKQKEKKHKLAVVKVTSKDFPAERIHVDRKRVFLSKKARKRVAKEQIFLNSNYFNPSEIALFDTPFMIPLDSYVTSIYGARRVFNNKKFTKHLGTDFRARIGTPIPAANSGKIVVSRDLFYTGLTVTIDHGLGIFTVYGHLSQLNVKEGDYVKKGDIIALSGNTGRTSGPHLHWGVKIHNQYIDGNSLVNVTERLFK